MTWHAITLTDLQSLLSRDLADCTAEQREFFVQANFAPAKWRLSPWGDDGGGFWVVAVHRDRVLWYNDIEEGFNVSRFESPGDIPSDEYWCNQDHLDWALRKLKGEQGTRLGPPQSLGDP